LKREVNIRKGEFHKTLVKYSEEGDTSVVCEFKNGKKHGIEELFYKNGAYAKLSYKADWLHGKFIDKFWDEEKG
jgi:antitoxin component YwqK of YwqJK toxin-antitoxin module